VSAEKNYLRSYLRVSPAALAVWRAIEAKHLATVDLPRPLLDLGCGFGEFTSVVFDDPVDIGLDIRLKDLKMAISGRMYKSLTQADARRMPFADGSLASVMSLSVLEHIPGIEKAVAETYRVLGQDGTFAFTAPTDKLNEMLFYTRAFNKIGLASLGRGYAWLYNKAVSHQSLLSEDEWLRMLERVGFEIERREMIIGRRALKAFDLTLPLAVPAQASRLLFGVRGVRRPDFIVDFWEKRLSSFVDEDTDEGSNVFIVARKR
jgi:ubiquinone/menaquinone biosynthesis C-methylase UbiE